MFQLLRLSRRPPQWARSEPRASLPPLPVPLPLKEIPVFETHATVDFMSAFSTSFPPSGVQEVV